MKVLLFLGLISLSYGNESLFRNMMLDILDGCETSSFDMEVSRDSVGEMAVLDVLVTDCGGISSNARGIETYMNSRHSLWYKYDIRVDEVGEGYISNHYIITIMRFVKDGLKEFDDI